AILSGMGVSPSCPKSAVRHESPSELANLGLLFEYRGTASKARDQEAPPREEKPVRLAYLIPNLDPIW
ncbi:MAG: hypothetical protein WB696_32210, partial [Chthoniobacterales bacterium]